MSVFDEMKASIPTLSLAERDELIGMMLDEAGPCATGGHNYIKVSTTKGEKGFFFSTPDVAHMVCKRCAKRLTIELN